MIDNNTIGFMILGLFIGYIINSLEGAFIGALIGFALSFLKWNLLTSRLL